MQYTLRLGVGIDTFQYEVEPDNTLTLVMDIMVTSNVRKRVVLSAGTENHRQKLSQTRRMATAHLVRIDETTWQLTNIDHSLIPGQVFLVSAEPLT